MKKLLLAGTAMAALSAATPASAQLGEVLQREILQQGLRNILGGGGGSVRLERLDDRIEQAFRRGEISRAEAEGLMEEFEQLRRLERDFRRGGLNREERFQLERRIDQLERQIEDARLNRDDRFDDDDRDGNGRFERGDRDDRFGRNRCPPGLAKRNNGCVPPGHARRDGRDFEGRDRDGNRDSDRFIFQRQSDGTVLQIDRRTGEVVRVIRGR